MTTKAIIFDFDGTLVNTLDDIVLNMNATLAKHNLPTYEADKYRALIGTGIKDLIKEILLPLKIEEAFVTQLVVEYREAYTKKWAINTKVYNGILELLTYLAKKHIPCCILTNKKQELTRIMVKHFFPNHHFELILGATPQSPKKPDPTLALKIAKELNLTPSEIIFVGDTQVDIQTALAAKMQPIGVLWGFRSAAELAVSGAKILIQNPAELKDSLAL
jgi:phosphoglycolate phosphatase